MASARQSIEQLRQAQDVDAIPTLAWSARPDGSAEFLNRRWLDYTGHEMEVGYSRLVTISTDHMLRTNEYRDGVGAHWTFLSDQARKVQKDLDIAEYTDPEHNPMIPHVIVLEHRLVIFKVYKGYWFFGCPTIEEPRQDLRAVLKRCPSGLGH